MFSSSLVFVHHHQWNLSSILILILLLCLSRLSRVFADDQSRWKRAIGGESLDSSNFVLYEDPATGFKYIEVPYEYMEQWLDDQRMWRTVIEFVLINKHRSTCPFLVVDRFSCSIDHFLRHIDRFSYSQLSNNDWTI